MDHRTCKSIVIERPREAAFRDITLAPRQPDSVIARAKEVLTQLEGGHAPTASVVEKVTSVKTRPARKKAPDKDSTQLDLFG